MILALTMFAAAVAYLPGVGSASTVGRWAVLSVGAAVLLSQIRRPLLGPAHVWAGLLLCWAALGLTWSVSPHDTLGELRHWLVLGVLFLAASQLRRPDWVLVAVVLGLCASIPFALGPSILPSPPETQPSGLFLNRNVMGEIAACVLVWCVARRAWLSAPVPLLLVALSGSRGAALAVIVGLAWIIWRSEHRRWLVLLAIPAWFGLAYAMLLGPDSFYARLDVWSLALYNLTWLGHGLETFGTLAPIYEFVHNDPIQLLFELGAGAVLAGAILAHALGRGPESAALVSILAASLVSYPAHHPMGAALVAVLAGLACGARYRSRRDELVLGGCGATRSAYEHEPADYLRRPLVGRPVVAA